MSTSRKVRVRLWKADPNCYWCKRATFLDFGFVNGRPCNLAATVDHLVSRNCGRMTNDYDHTVLACYQCNSARDNAEQNGRYISKIVLNAGGHPQYFYSEIGPLMTHGHAYLEEAISAIEQTPAVTGADGK